MSISESTLQLIRLATTVTVKQTPHIIPEKKDKDGNVIQKSQVVYTTTKTKHIDPKVMNSLFSKRGALFESLSQMRSKIKMPKVDQKATFPVWDNRKKKYNTESYTYSSLAKLIDAVDKGITDSKTHLSFTFNSDQQFISVQVYNRRYHKTISMPGTRVSVSVRVADGKGGWAEDIGKFTVDVTGQDGQSIGGGYTYARRYSLSLALGVSGLKPDNTNRNSIGTSLDESEAHNSGIQETSNPANAAATASQISSVKHYALQWAKVDGLKKEQPYSWLKSAHKANINLNDGTVKMSASQAKSAIRDMRSFIATQLSKPADAKHVAVLNKAIDSFSKTGGHAKSKIYAWLKKTYNVTINTKTSPAGIVITNSNLVKAIKDVKGFQAQEAKKSNGTIKSSKASASNKKSTAKSGK